MKVLENQTAYKCEHCSKFYLQKRWIERHEKFCHKNPNNQHKCFQFCKHLEKITHSIDDSERSSGTYTEFRCKKLDKYLYSFKAEKHTNPFLMERLDGCERMPLECSDYSDANYVPDQYFMAEPEVDLRDFQPGELDRYFDCK